MTSGTKEEREEEDKGEEAQSLLEQHKASMAGDANKGKKEREQQEREKAALKEEKIKKV